MFLRKVCVLLAAIAAVFMAGCSEEDPPRTGLAKPNFTYIAPNWDTTVNEQAMQNLWSSYEGVNRAGTNYYLLPKAKAPNTGSERFNPASNYFQAWCGIYTVEDDTSGTYGIRDGEVVVEDIIKLASADQKAWLEYYGVATPATAVTYTLSNYTSQKVKIDGTDGWKISGTMTSRVDVGDNSNDASKSGLFYVDAGWGTYVISYASVTLDGVFYVWYSPENKELNVAYYNGVSYMDKSSVSRNTLPSIQAELEQMAKAITVYE